MKGMLTHAKSESGLEAVWVVGSVASGTDDVWSDVDLILVCDAGLIRERRSLARAVGPVLLEWDAPQNAAPGSMHYCAVFDRGPLPFGVDLHLWPRGSARPSDSVVLYESAPSTTGELSFEAIQKQAADRNTGRTLPEMPPEERRQFRLAMLYPICADLARGWPESAAVMVEWLGYKAPQPTTDAWLAHLDVMLGSLGEGLASSVREKYRNLLSATEWVLHQES